MKKIGLISDTHGKIPSELHEIFVDVDEIWHIGDFGGELVLDELELIAPLRGVRGNVDGFPLISRFPEHATIQINGYSLLLIHRFCDETGRLFSHAIPLVEDGFDAIIYGHTHIPELKRMENGVLLFNPGSATFPRKGKNPSVGILSISDDQKLEFQHIFLKKI